MPLWQLFCSRCHHMGQYGLVTMKKEMPTARLHRLRFLMQKIIYGGCCLGRESVQGYLSLLTNPNNVHRLIFGQIKRCSQTPKKETHPMPQTKQQTNLGVFKTSKALACLYNHAAPFLTDIELAYLAEAVNQAQVETEQMSIIMEGLGCLIEIGKGAFDDSTPALLWQTSSHLDLIAGLTWIGCEADLRLSNSTR